MLSLREVAALMSKVGSLAIRRHTATLQGTNAVAPLRSQCPRAREESTLARGCVKAESSSMALLYISEYVSYLVG